jgi:hypothetical protein
MTHQPPVEMLGALPSVTDSDVRSHRLRRGEQPRDVLRCDLTVCVAVANPLAPCTEALSQACSDRGAVPEVSFVSNPRQHSGVLPAQLAEDGSRVVGAAIIDDDDVKGFVPALQMRDGRPHDSRQVTRLIPCWQKYGQSISTGTGLSLL